MEISGVGIEPVPDVARTSANRVQAAAGDEAAAVDPAVSVDLQSAAGSPPPEVSAAIDAASQVYEQLDARGQHVQFSSDPSTGALNIELQHPDGSSSTLSPGQLLDLAEGDGPKP